MFKKQTSQAFTLVEILVTIVIIAILTIIVIPNVTRAMKQAKYAKAKHFIKDISDAVEVYSAVTGRFPTTITSLTSANPPFINPQVANKYCNPDATLTKVVDGYGHVCMFNITAGGENFAYYTFASEVTGSGYYLVGLYQSGANRGKYLYNETNP